MPSFERYWSNPEHHRMQSRTSYQRHVAERRIYGVAYGKLWWRRINLSKKKLAEYRQRYQKWYEKNRERRLAQAKARYELKRDEIIPYQSLRTAERRRELPVPELILNERFPGSELHHMGNGLGIYLPHKIHRGIFHSLTRNINMGKINRLALDWLEMQK